MRKVVGLLGLKGVGKDTAAHHLVKYLGYLRIGFADALYKEVAEAFGVTVEFLGNRDTKETDLPVLALKNCSVLAFADAVAFEKGWTDPAQRALEMTLPRSPRFVMQFWGTEFRRKHGKDSYWLDIVQAAFDAHPTRSFVVTDVRFPNEFDFIGLAGGERFRIRNFTLEAAAEADRAKSGSFAHSSETALLKHTADADLINTPGDRAPLRRAILSQVRAPLLVQIKAELQEWLSTVRRPRLVRTN
jgi:hypothetical protein